MELWTLSWILYGVIILIFFIIIFYFYMTRNFGYWKKRGVREITPTPFVGNFGKYFKHEKSPGALFKNFYDQNKDQPYVGIYILDKPCLLIRDTELLKLILIKDFNYFTDKFMRCSKNDVISNNSLFFIENPHWKFLRKKYSILFTTTKMKTMIDNVKEIGNDLNDYLDSLQLEGAGKSVNVKKLASKFTIDLIGQTSFGIKFNSLKNTDTEFRKFHKTMFGTYNFKRSLELATLWLAPDYATLFGFRFFLKITTNFFRKYFQNILDERTKSKLKRNDFIDWIIQLRDNENNNSNSNGFKFEGDNLLSQALTIFVAGYDTSSTIMSFALFELAKNREMQSKLRDEINGGIKKNNGQITYEMTTDLEYLDMIISETLRMYPTLPLIDRKTTKNYKIEETGLIIEKGTPILIPMLGFHYDEKYFPNPHNFNPERFSSDGKSSINPYVYLPFGIGARNCIGMRQGLLQTKLGIIFIISRFEVSMLENNCINFDKLLVPSSSKGGLFLNIRKINLFAFSFFKTTMLLWILYGVIILIFFITILYFYMTRNFGYWKKRGVKEITPTPFIGNFGKYFKYEKSPGTLFKYFYNQSEGLPYVGIYILDKPCLLIRDPELLKLILIKDFNYFSDKFMRSCKNDSVSNNCLLIIDNPYWKYIRQKFTGLFTTGKMKSMVNNVKEVGDDLNDYLDSLHLEGSGKSINIKDIAGKFTTDLIGQAAFGLKLNSLKNPNAEFRQFGKAMFGTYNFKRAIELATVWLAPDYTNLFGFRFFLESAANFLRTAFRDILDERIKSKLKRNDFIDLMIQLRDNENNNPESNGFKFEGDNILAQALIIYTAGYDTSSAVMSSCLFELAKHSEMQSKLRTEINEAIKKNNGEITYEMITNLQYLDMILSETLRLYPTLPFIDRKATRNYKIEKTGLIIEKGTPILIPMLGFHYDEKYFPNPREFDPERFSSDRKSSINPYVYLPFGIGGRNCIGMRQGLLQSKLGVIHIISRFEVSLLKNTSIKFDKLSVLGSSKGGLFLNVRKIDPEIVETLTDERNLMELLWIFYSLLAILTLIIIIVYFYLTRNFGYWKKRGVKEIPPTPFVGNCGKYFKYEKSPGALFKCFYDEHPNLPYVGIYMIDEPCLLIRDPEILKRIFIKDFNFFTDKLLRSGKNDVSNNSLFFIENPHWKYLRQKFTHLFTPSKMKSKFDNMLEIGRDLDDYLDKLQLEGSGKEIDVKEVSGKFMTDVIGLILFGLKCNSLKDPEAELRKFGKAMFGTYSFKRAIEISIIFLAPQFADLFGCKFIFENAYNFFTKVFEEVLNERKNSKIKGNDFLDVIIQLRDNEVKSPHGLKLQGDNLSAQAVLLFAAGFEPPSAVMAFCLFELAKHKEIQNKLRNQINDGIIKNNGKITYELVTELQYLDMILSETLRKYPTMPVMDRKATKDYKIEETGLVIEKGTAILVPLLGLHYDPQYFPDPEKFDPERFSSDNKLRNPYVNMPFGLGSRGCIASRQGLLQVKLGLIVIISRFEVSLLKKTSIEFDKLSALTSSKGGLFLNIRKI
ncbi:uncharacterized protein LOC127285301 [Leptopilina boulardi]|uniref:uncharacterized protein LOC127285301 n=1 Tax=Leptopilina boulardi TaxID=63433 RepID=UPI0021F5730E|nr:uncharacterized protein LOC127285301 [Leptopilina boulardi]